MVVSCSVKDKDDLFDSLIIAPLHNLSLKQCGEELELGVDIVY